VKTSLKQDRIEDMDILTHDQLGQLLDAHRKRKGVAWVRLQNFPVGRITVQHVDGRVETLTVSEAQKLCA